MTMQTIHPITRLNPHIRRAHLQPRYPIDFAELRFPLLLVTCRHQHPSTVDIVDDASDLRALAAEKYDRLCSTDPDLGDQSFDQLSDEDLLDVLADDLHAIHLVQMPSSHDFRIELDPRLAHNFPWAGVSEMIREGVAL